MPVLLEADGRMKPLVAEAHIAGDPGKTPVSSDSGRRTAPQICTDSPSPWPAASMTASE